MKKRELVLFSAVFGLLMTGTAYIVLGELTGFKLFGAAPKHVAMSDPIKCTNMGRKSYPKTDDPQLKVIPEYEQACDSSFFDSMMIFTNMPANDAIAKKDAVKMAARLKEFSAAKIKPIMIVEPDSQNGLVDFHEFARGDYDQYIQTYFKQLKANGIGDSTLLGTVIPFPEPQQPYWNNNADPDDFSLSVNRYFKILRSEYPKAATAILLDVEYSDQTGPTQLMAYTRLIDDSLVDAAGVQGFPWNPTGEDDTRKPITTAAKFLPAATVEEVAKSLGVKKVLLNTGTYRHKKLENGGNIAIATNERRDELQSIVDEVQILRGKGYEVTVNIFAEDKFDKKEGVDWSYWKPGSPSSESHLVLFTRFVHSLIGQGAGVSVFDNRQ